MVAGRFRARVGAALAFGAVVTGAIMGPSGLTMAEAQSDDSLVRYTVDLASPDSGESSTAEQISLGTASLSTIESDSTRLAYDISVRGRGRQIIGLRLHWVSPSGPGGVVAVLDHRDRSSRPSPSGGLVDFDGTFGSETLTGPWRNLSLAEFAERAEAGRIVVGLATEFGGTRFVDYLPLQTGMTPTTQPDGRVGEFVIADDGSSMAYTIDFDAPERRIIGLRLHWTSTGGPGGVAAVLDHRAGSERPDGTIELAGTFSMEAFTGPWRGRSIAELQRQIDDGGIVVGVATEDLRVGPFPGPTTRTIDYLPALMSTATVGPATGQVNGSAELSFEPDGSSFGYVVRVPDLGSRIIGLRVQGRPGTGRGCESSVGAVLNHQSRSVLDDGTTVIEGTFDGPWQWWDPAPTFDQIDSLYLTVATEANRLGAICGPMIRS